MKRLFDILSSFLALILLSPVLLLIALFVGLGSNGGVLYMQERIGKKGKPFRLLKFRSMKVGSDKNGLLTVGSGDSRVTTVGKFIRRYKLDELPQLINILKGEMSVVGPRPEVRKYVDLYTPEQRQVLEVRPGLTDYASLSYIDEDELLAQADNAEEFYVRKLMPEKLQLNLKYIEERNFWVDLRVIGKTIGKIFS